MMVINGDDDDDGNTTLHHIAFILYTGLGKCPSLTHDNFRL